MVSVASVGHNLPPKPQGFEAIQLRWNELLATVSGWLNQVPTIEDQQQSDDLAGLKKQLMALGKEAEAQRKANNEAPQKLIDDNNEQFKPVTSGIKKCLEMIEPKLTAWLQKVKAENARVAREAQEKADALKKEAEAAARRAERAAEEALSGGRFDSATATMADIIKADAIKEKAEAAEKEAEKLSRAKAQTGGQYSAGGVKRSVGLREFTNYDVVSPKHAVAFFFKKYPADFIILCEELARRHARDYAGVEMDGIKVKITEKAV